MNSIVNRNINYEYLGLLFLALFPILPHSLLSIALVTYCLLAILNNRLYKKSTFSGVVSKINIFKIILFYIFLISISIFQELDFKVILKVKSSLPILLFGLTWILFSRLEFSKKELRRLFSTFVMSSFTLGCIILVNSIYDSSVANIPFYNIVRFTIQNISFLDLHPVYVSLYFIFSLLYIILNYRLFNTFLAIFLITFFVSIIILISSRVAIITTLALLIHYFFYAEHKKKLIPIGIILLVLFSIAIFSLKPFRTQFKEIYSLEEYKLPYQKFPSSPQIRIGIYNCSFELIKNNYVLGSGLLSFQNDLELCYEKYNNYEKINYNTHNYYLYLLGSSGIFCLLLFFYSLKTQITIAFNTKNYLFLYFTIIIATFSLTENILSRSYGIAFFVFCLTLFLSTAKNKHKL